MLWSQPSEVEAMLGRAYAQLALCFGIVATRASLCVSAAVQKCCSTINLLLQPSYCCAKLIVVSCHSNRGVVSHVSPTVGIALYRCCPLRPPFQPDEHYMDTSQGIMRQLGFLDGDNELKAPRYVQLTRCQSVASRQHVRQAFF